MEGAIILQEREGYHAQVRPLSESLGQGLMPGQSNQCMEDLYAKHSSMSSLLKDSEQWQGLDGAYCMPNSILSSLLSYLTMFW